MVFHRMTPPLRSYRETGHYNNHLTVMPPWHDLIRIFKAMGWADWMVVNQSLEEELEVERSVERFTTAKTSKP